MDFYIGIKSFYEGGNCESAVSSMVKVGRCLEVIAFDQINHVMA